MEPVVSSAPFAPPIDSNESCHVLLFGDLTISFEEDFRQLLHCKSNGALQSFFNQVNHAFRKEFALLQLEEQEWLPKFTDLVDLVAFHGSTIGSQALRFALLCVYQLGRFINSDSYPDAARCYLVGICTGSFAAAAVASSRTMRELIPAGVEAVLVAFRTGLHSMRMQRDIEPLLTEGFRSWSIIVGLTEDKALEILQKFSAEETMSRSSRPYLSAITPSTVTISGPPSVLERLVNAFDLKAHATQISTPYHAAHLNTSREIDEVLETLRDESLKEYRLRIPILSAATGTLVEALDFRGLLRNAVEVCLCEQVRWDKVGPGLSTAFARERSLKSCTVCPIASNAASLLCSTLQQQQQQKQQKHLEIAVSNVLNTGVGRDDTSPATGSFQDSKIAVVGFSGRFPDAASNDELWQILMAARDCHRTIPEDRFDWKAHHDPTGKKKNTSRIKHGCWIKEPGVFDARFFNVSPREAESMDPSQRLALMAAYEAMEMGGMVPDRTPSTQRDRVGVFFGMTSDDWREVNSGQNVDTYFIPGSNRAFLPGRISYFFRFCGPSICVDTACSSSFAAIATACSSLQQGDCDTAIAGGTNVLTNPDNFAGLDRAHFLSTTGNCNAFDDAADGYCRADAVGAVVLKRLEDALADHDPIFGVIAGSGTNHCGQTVSITRPHEGDQLSLFRSLVRHANIDPIDVSYVEMHGTGTQAGDAAEMRSVLSAFAWDHRRSSMTPRRPLHLGAIKASVGHAESGSGVTALIKVLMMMQRSLIPPHRLDGQLNRHYPDDLAQRDVHIAFKPTPWRREDCRNGKRMSLLNNFSAAGGNTAILLEDAPLRVASGAAAAVVAPDPRSLFPVAVSAKTPKALEENVRALLAYIESNPATPLPALSYTTTARRMHHKFRALFAGADNAAINAALRRYIDQNAEVKAIRAEPPRTAFVFTGQGTPFTGVDQQLFDHIAAFRANILRFDRIAQRQGFPSFLPSISGKEIDIEDPVVAQLGHACVQMAISHLWRLWVGEPSSVVGHSLGEYAALYAAGVLSASDAVYLVGIRAQLLAKLCTKSTHAMLAVKAPLASVAPEIADTVCTVACINSPTDTVISGPKAEVQQLLETLKSKSVVAKLLDVPYAFHSAQVDAIMAEFTTLASTVQFHRPAIPYLSALLSQVVDEADILNASYVVQAARECVNFQGAIESAREAKLVTDSTIWIEIGAHPTCSGMIQQIINSRVLTLPTLRKGVDTWNVLVGSLQVLYREGAEIQWEEFHRGFEAAQEVLSLPAYKWELKNYWIQYRHNFCLTKGDDPATFAPIASSTAPAATVVAAAVSSSVHRVLEESNTPEISTFLFESDLHDDRLFPIVAGHMVNTALLCPSSLFADMALTIAKYILKSNEMLNDKVGLDCSAMSVHRTLIAQPDATSQLLRVSAKADWSKNEIVLSFFSVAANARKIADHASCVVKIVENQNWLNEWRRNAYLISSRISSLREAVDDGSAHKLKRGLAYKLFSSLVDYAPIYQGMEQVILDSDSLEATAEVRLQVGDMGFECNPCWIDSLGHIAGFIMNGNDNVASKERIFINHGWDAMRCAKPIERAKSYTTYNRMQLESGTTYVGDTFIFEGQELVAIFEGVRFQGVNRSVLDHLLPGKARAPVAKVAAKPTPTTARPAKTETVPTPSRKASSPAASQPSKATRALKIITEEAQVEENAIKVETEFADLGIDSLLWLNITSRLREQLDLEVSSSAFVDYPTVGSLITFLGCNEGDVKENPSQAESGGASTPQSSKDEDAESYSTDLTTTESEDVGPQADIMAIIRKVISDETGIAIEDVSADAALTELGVDSLLSLTIMNTLAEQIDAEIPSTAFLEWETLGDAEAALCKMGIITKPLTKPISAKLSKPIDLAEVAAPPHASSVVLQGSPKKAKINLFLFPDGAGSASSYHALPSMSPDFLVYGLNCPWLKMPENLRCSLEQYVAKFLVEIRRRQPKGPYHLGGMSAGGILAYEAAQQLSRAGEKVNKLILIDTPDPVGLENPNERLYDFLDQMGMFGLAGDAPKWLRPHFDAFLDVLDDYDVKEFEGPVPPPTYIIYARDGMCKNPEDPRPELRPDDPREMKWLLNNRTDFSGGGWNKLLGKKNLNISTLADVNHYTILRPGPMIKELSNLIASALRA